MWYEHAMDTHTDELMDSQTYRSRKYNGILRGWTEEKIESCCPEGIAF